MHFWGLYVLHGYNFELSQDNSDTFFLALCSGKTTFQMKQVKLMCWLFTLNLCVCVCVFTFIALQAMLPLG